MPQREQRSQIGIGIGIMVPSCIAPPSRTESALQNDR
jgi:hypothetical protein